VNDQPSRDLAGYGAAQPRFSWPGGAKVAVSLVVNFEEGSELSVADGDAVDETGKGKRDPTADQQFAYGMRAGFWRVLEALDKHRRQATFYMCGRAVERTPETAKAAVAAGHEPALHGWRWQAHAGYASEDDERKDITRSVEVISKVTGERPLGFFCRGNESRWTRHLLREQGFVYASNAFDDDIPYWDKSEQQPLLVVPYAFDTNDMRFGKPGGFVAAKDFSSHVDDALSVLIGEGQLGRPKMMSIGLHLRMIGRPAQFKALLDILHLIDLLGDKVWVARRIDIARFWAQQFPAS
jgi:peptidoglycan/xylan/chitin deacetylase (PgdA/CDA1 family)